MIDLTARSLRRLVIVVGLSLIVFVIIHQVNYGDKFALTSHLSELIEVIKACPQTTSKPLDDSRSNVDSGIPNLIHQIWKTADVHTYSTEASHESWKAMFEPMNYTVKLWTEDDILSLVKTAYPWLLSTYEGYPQNIQRADVARLMVVHAKGGIYADLDVHPKSVEEMLCLQHSDLEGIFAPTAGTLGLSNHFFMAQRGSAFLLWTLHEAKRRGGPRSKRIILPYLRVFWSTGPMMVTSAFRKYAWMHSTMDHDIGLLDESYGGSLFWHAAGRSWHEWDGRLLNIIGDHMAVENPWVVFSFLVTFLGFAYIMARRCYKVKSRQYKNTSLSGKSGL
ncbi:hypothetical protein BGW36DRAFT_432685 [Talaromyces proteolyticus]|uniref:Uncharacterized protein n=1 Tax=Talaromyces proteolyticus TaxID=1131652 RepID=A0AAD4PW11_9EURO|nr:uncharacterized protein BGW36DRAFT_432685 [Talaromyces proteolyticus]KAH8690910.1 hypothetical protein BGW36DRAFT_432685 [Talaromyces proteolyticus]